MFNRKLKKELYWISLIPALFWSNPVIAWVSKYADDFQDQKGGGSGLSALFIGIFHAIPILFVAFSTKNIALTFLATCGMAYFSIEHGNSAFIAIDVVFCAIGFWVGMSYIDHEEKSNARMKRKNNAAARRYRSSYTIVNEMHLEAIANPEGHFLENQPPSKVITSAINNEMNDANLTRLATTLALRWRKKGYVKTPLSKDERGVQINLISGFISSAISKDFIKSIINATSDFDLDSSSEMMFQNLINLSPIFDEDLLIDMSNDNKSSDDFITNIFLDVIKFSERRKLLESGDAIIIENFIKTQKINGK